jgi:hypothetical protein
MEVHYIYAYEDRIMKSTKHCLKEGKKAEGKMDYKGGGELVQGTLYICMELSQISSYY